MVKWTEFQYHPFNKFKHHKQIIKAIDSTDLKFKMMDLFEYLEDQAAKYQGNLECKVITFYEVGRR